MSTPGWYPDPGGAPGRFRWWDGTSWSTTTTADPRSTVPDASATGAPAGRPRPRRRVWPWALGLGALVVALVVIGWFVVRPLVVTIAGGDPDPTGTSTQELCPPTSTESPSLPAQANDGRVHGGPLSYPRLGSPWSPPQTDSGIPFGRDVALQSIQTEDDPAWLAGVFVARLVAGDGFFSPEEGSKIVVRCVMGTYYGNNDVGREDKRNVATTVDGHDAWLVETHFTFDVTGVDAKGEWVLIVIIDAGDGTAGLFFASVPDNASQYMAPARQAYAGLKVSS